MDDEESPPSLLDILEAMEDENVVDCVHRSPTGESSYNSKVRT